MPYFTGKGYGVSKYVDITGVPLLSYTIPATGESITLFDRVAVQADPTIKQVLTIDKIDGGRMDLPTSSALKKAVGGTSAEELDHIISLELGGSNQLANLGLDTNTPGTTNNPTDTFENQLSAAVQAGSISLLDAWRAEASAKGKLLAEDMEMRTNSDWATAAKTALGAAYNLLTGGIRGTLNKNLDAQIKQDYDQLSATPYDIKLRTKIFTEQINMTAEQLNLSQADAAAYIKVYTARYAQNQGQHPTEVIAGLEANLQQLLRVSGENPNILGIDNSVWINVAGVAAAGAGILSIVGVIGFIIALFVSSPADALAAAGGAGVAGFLGSIGVSATALGVLATTELVAGALAGIAFLIPMITKQMLDAKYIAPSLISTGLKNDIDLLKKQGVSVGGTSASASTLPTTYPPSSSQSSSASSGGTSSGASVRKGGTITGTQVYVTTINGGVLGAVAGFTPHEKDIIEDATELASVAELNLSQYVAAIPSLIVYDIRLVPNVMAADGTMRVGGERQILHSTSKKGIKHYKTVTNKFAVADIYVITAPGKRVKIEEVILGPVDIGNWNPTHAALAQVSSHLNLNLVTNQLAGISQINMSTSPTEAPTTIEPIQTTAQLPPKVEVPQITIDSSYFVDRTRDPGTLYRFVGNDLWEYNPYQDLFTDAEHQALAQDSGKFLKIPAKLLEHGVNFDSFQAVPFIADIVGAHAQNTVLKLTFAEFFSGATATPSPAAPHPASLVCSAASLFAFYDAEGKTLPNISIRGNLYEQLGLGTASLYTGTAVENTKLLAGLKTQAGC